jgi:hypothetical protein
MALRTQHGTVEDPGQIGGGAFSKEVPAEMAEGGPFEGGTVCPMMPLSVASAAPGGRAQVAQMQVGRVPVGQGQDGRAQIVPVASVSAASVMSATSTGGTSTGGTSTGGTSTGGGRILSAGDQGDRAARRAGARRRRSNDRVIHHRRNALDREAGMATAEYAIATLAAVGFAALLVAVLSSGEVRGLLMSLITSALNFG